MSSLSSQYLQRAQELFDRYRYAQRELARLRPAPPVRAEPEAGFWDFLREDIDEPDVDEGPARQLDQIAAALRVAVDNLVNVYCDEIRRSPWYIASYRRRTAEVDAARAPRDEEARLVAFARSLGRELRTLFDEVVDSTRMTLDIAIGVDGEFSIFERWRELRFNLSRLLDRALVLGLPALTLPKNSYVPKEAGRRNALEALALAVDQGPGSGPMLDWLQENLFILNDSLNAWIEAAEAAIESPGIKGAEREVLDLEEDVVAAARQRLPANLRPWHALPE
ncbi:hypothetical protein [Dongia sp.]|uniref:hypothetical protein n=1 Tax=Dongia sp. TaxID=1977262 RepID=UPI0035AFEF0C